jgi:WD40 repeat protein
VRCVIQFNDGRLLSCSEDKTLKIWDAISGSCLMTLEGHISCVLCVTQLVDGRLVSGFVYTTLRIWDTISSSCLMTLKGHTSWVRCVIQLMDGRLVSGSDDKTLKIWDAISGSCLMTLEGHTNNVRCVFQLKDGRLVSASWDRTLKIWNIMSLSQQKWIRRRLLLLLYEASKILNKPLESEVINQDQYLRCHDLELLFRGSLDIENNINNLEAFKITLKVLSMPEIAIRVAEYL